MSLLPCVHLLDEVSIKVFGPFLKSNFMLLLSFKSPLYILDRVYQMSLLKYFSPVCGLSSSSLNIVSLKRGKVFNFRKSSLSIISFMDHVFIVAKKAVVYSGSFLPVL